MNAVHGSHRHKPFRSSGKRQSKDRLVPHHQTEVSDLLIPLRVLHRNDDILRE